jgi:hypothetical protein
MFCHSNISSSKLVLCSFTFLIALLHQDNALVQGAAITLYPPEGSDDYPYYGGDSGGFPFSDSSSTPRQIKSLAVYHRKKSGTFISGLKVEYKSLTSETLVDTFTHGTTSDPATLAFSYTPGQGERITLMKVKYGSFVDSLEIETDGKQTFFAGGSGGSALKTIYFAPGEEFKFFEGRAGTWLDGLRIATGPVPAVPATPAPSAPPLTNPSTDAPIDTTQSCLDNTLVILEGVQAIYPSNEKIIETILNNKTTEIVDFDDAGANALYEKECSKNSAGVYVELTYESACVNGEYIINVFVARQPRCYSAQLCDLEVHEQALFEEYALRLTEERNGGGWSCTGQLLKNGIDSGCLYETMVLNDIDKVFTENFEVKAELKDSKFLFIFPKAEKEVTFPSFEDPEVISLGEACEEGGGILKKAGYSTFLCGENMEYVVHDFPVCIGNSCTIGAVDSFKAAITSQFQAKIVKADERFKNTPNVKCTLTASSSKPLLGAATGFGVSMLAAVWHLLA